jgi:hypothetical protein
MGDRGKGALGIRPKSPTPLEPIDFVENFDHFGSTVISIVAEPEASSPILTDFGEDDLAHYSKARNSFSDWKRIQVGNYDLPLLCSDVFSYFFPRSSIRMAIFIAPAVGQPESI